MIKCSEMYTFVVSNRKSIIVEDYVFATYGHGLSDNSVIQHDFFGTDLVVNDLKNFRSYKLGKIYLTDNMFKRNDYGPDHAASLEPNELKDMIQKIRNIEKAFGSEIKKPSKSEKKNINVARKSVVAKKNIKKGEKFSITNLTVKRPGTGLSPMEWDKIIDRESEYDFNQDDLIKIKSDI